MTENNVAAQAGDEPMREAFFAWFAEHGSGHQYKESQDAFCAGYQAATPPDEPEPTEAYWGVAANGARCAFGRYGFAKAWAGKNGTVETVQLRQFTLIEPQFSPRATTAVAEALQVCVKALEFRKERSANDEFALNLARIALAEAPRATADVERDAARYRWLRDPTSSRWASGYVKAFHHEALDKVIDDETFALSGLATTKPGA